MTIKVHVSVVIEHEGRLLMVREYKEANRGKWNLPGGHLEFGEMITAGAIREAREETLLKVSVRSLVGVYEHLRSELSPPGHSLRFVFRAAVLEGVAAAGDEIMAIAWMTPAEVLAMDDAQLLSAKMLRRILRDLSIGRQFPIDVLDEAPYAQASDS